MEQGYIPPITIGKIYETVILVQTFSWVDDMNYKIINDKGFESWEFKENFITLEQHREQQLNKII